MERINCTCLKTLFFYLEVKQAEHKVASHELHDTTETTSRLPASDYGCTEGNYSSDGSLRRVQAIPILAQAVAVDDNASAPGSLHKHAGVMD